jgi:hypothetical protein
MIHNEPLFVGNLKSRMIKMDEKTEQPGSYRRGEDRAAKYAGL